MNPIELLVVDDNAAETVLLLYALEDCPRPINFHFAKDGVEGLQLLQERTFDLVILDLNLPGLSGYDVLRHHRPKNVPIVMFSVSSNPEDAKRSLELGACEFVQKPIRLEAYKHAVLTMIEKWAVGTSKVARV
jgi:CheY-like chemotaxis protein